MKITKKLCAVLIAAALAIPSLCVSVSAEDISPEELSILCYNVEGLPSVPYINDIDRDVINDTELIGEYLNSSGYDIIALQEDFNFHFLLKNCMKSYPYSSIHSGGVPVGDGLNIYSKYPIYNVERIEWDEHYGVLDAGSDELTPKGILYCTVELAQGVLIDFYNIHVDAYGDDCSEEAKRSNFLQLSELIEEKSTGRPVIITGDFNCTLHNSIIGGLYENLLEKSGLKDVWAELENNGDYFRGDNRDSLISDWYTRYSGNYWGLWDSVERFEYSDGSGITLTPTSHEYVNITDSSGRSLSDHVSARVTFTYDVTSTESGASLVIETEKPFSERLAYMAKKLCKTFFLLLNAVLETYILPAFD